LVLGVKNKEQSESHGYFADDVWAVTEISGRFLNNWETGMVGGEDSFARAEAFVQRRRLGEIPGEARLPRSLGDPTNDPIPQRRNILYRRVGVRTENHPVPTDVRRARYELNFVGSIHLRLDVQLFQTTRCCAEIANREDVTRHAPSLAARRHRDESVPKVMFGPALGSRFRK
jgi:hypothetical protein